MKVKRQETMKKNIETCLDIEKVDFKTKGYKNTRLEGNS